MSNDETTEEAGNFAAQTKATFPVIHDPKNAVYDRFGVSAAPTNVVVDRKGTVVYAHAGEDLKGLVAAVEKAMAAK